MAALVSLAKKMASDSKDAGQETHENASDFGWFIDDCILANNKWLQDHSFIWNGTLRSGTSQPHTDNDPDTRAREAQHGHMELKYPGPMPDARGASVVDYTRVYPHGIKYGVINSAFNALDQEHVLTIYFIVGPGEPEGAATRAFDVEGVRLHLQRTGFFNTGRREQRLGPVRERNPLYFENQRCIFLVDSPAGPGHDYVLPVKFVVGAADRDLTAADLRMWFCMTGFFDQRGRNGEIAAQLELVGAQHAQLSNGDGRVQEYLAGLDPGNAFR